MEKTNNKQLSILTEIRKEAEQFKKEVSEFEFSKLYDEYVLPSDLDLLDELAFESGVDTDDDTDIDENNNEYHTRIGDYVKSIPNTRGLGMYELVDTCLHDFASKFGWDKANKLFIHNSLHGYLDLYEAMVSYGDDANNVPIVDELSDNNDTYHLIEQYVLNTVGTLHASTSYTCATAVRDFEMKHGKELTCELLEKVGLDMYLNDLTDNEALKMLELFAKYEKEVN